MFVWSVGPPTLLGVVLKWPYTMTLHSGTGMSGPLLQWGLGSSTPIVLCFCLAVMRAKRHVRGLLVHITFWNTTEHGILLCMLMT